MIISEEKHDQKRLAQPSVNQQQEQTRLAQVELETICVSQQPQPLVQAESPENAYLNAYHALDTVASREEENSPIRKRLEEMLTHVDQMQQSGCENINTLTIALRTIYELLENDSDLEIYKQLANSMRGRPSPAMQILGGIIVALGVAVAGLAFASFDGGVTAFIVGGAISAALGMTLFGANARKTGLCRDMSNVLNQYEEDVLRPDNY